MGNYFFGNIVHIIPTIAVILGTLVALIHYHIKDIKIKVGFALVGLFSWVFALGYFVMGLIMGVTFGTEFNIFVTCLLILLIRSLSLGEILMVTGAVIAYNSLKDKKKKDE